MASLYILILMTPTAKLFLSLPQVPQPHLSLEKRLSTPHYEAGPLARAIKAAGEKDEGREEGKRHRGRVRELAISRKEVFLSHFPHLSTVRYPPPLP